MTTLKTIFILLFTVNFIFAGDTPQVIKIKTSAVCGMCKRKIEKNLAYEKGIEDVNLDIPSKILTVSYNPKKTNSATIKKIVNNTGYDADEMAATPEAYEKLSSCCKKELPVHN
ncbi:MAG: heavy metal-associated domain-containing protein [Bacteroidota bacterium]